jgi:hypothetical protein
MRWPYDILEAILVRRGARRWRVDATRLAHLQLRVARRIASVCFAWIGARSRGSKGKSRAAKQSNSMRIACTKSVRKRGGLTVGGLFSSDQRDQVPSLRRVEAQSVQANNNIKLYK